MFDTTSPSPGMGVVQVACGIEATYSYNRAMHSFLSGACCARYAHKLLSRLVPSYDTTYCIQILKSTSLNIMSSSNRVPRAIYSLPKFVSDVLYHTGRFCSLRVPLMTSSARAMYGPMTGTLPTNPAMVAMKSPNRTRMPYSSMMKPKNAQRIRISVMPKAKAAVPFHFCLRAKKATVLVVPIMRVRPIRKRI